MFSLPLFRLFPFLLLFPQFVPRTLRAAFCHPGCRRRAFWEERGKPTNSEHLWQVKQFSFP